MSTDAFFRRILLLSTAISFGSMLALLALIERSPNGNLAFRFHWASIPLWIAGAGAAVWLWRTVFQFEQGDTDRKRRRLKWMAATLGLMAVSSFGYPLRFVDPQKRGEVFIGLACAILVLTFFGWMIWKAIGLVSSNEPKDGECE